MIVAEQGEADRAERRSGADGGVYRIAEERQGRDDGGRNDGRCDGDLHADRRIEVGQVGTGRASLRH
jgi:hypothetical protein